MPIQLQQRRHRQAVVTRRHQRLLAFDQIGKGAVFIDCKIIYHGLHRERQCVLQLALGLRHDLLQSLLRLSLALRRKNETHAAAGHTPQHPKPPKILRKLALHSLDQGLRKIIARPRNDGLYRLPEIPHRRRSDRLNISLPQRRQNLIQNA